MKILITEAYNIAGDSLLRLMKSETNFDIYLLSEKAKEQYHNGNIHLYPCNILNFKVVKDIAYKIKPDFIINTLDYGDLQNNNHKKIWDTNVFAFENICSIARVLDCHLITISNDFVFDGEKGLYSEQDKPCAISYYGTSKHAMENTCLINVIKCTIVRASLLYGYNFYGYQLLNTNLIYTLKAKREHEISGNYYTNPCLADEFAYAVIKIIEKRRTGIYHVSGSEYLSISDFTVKVAIANMLDPGMIKVIPEKQIQRNPEEDDYIPPKKNPMKFGLVNYKSETDLGIKFSNIDSGLMAMKHYIYGEKLLPI